MFDLGAYLARIGLGDTRSIPDGRAASGACHAIPFENLDPQRGVPISLEPDDINHKLVDAARRLLLRTEPAAEGGARCNRRRGRPVPGPGSPRPPAGTPRPRTHLVLRVRADGRDWHADVGFGRGTLLEPIPFGTGGPYEQSGWRYRVIQDGPELVLQTGQDAEWVDLYGFVPEPVPFIDVETSNWFTSTHPRSPFVTGLIVAAQRPDGTRLTLSDWEGPSLTEETPAGASVRPVQEGEVEELIAGRFGLDGGDG